MPVRPYFAFFLWLGLWTSQLWLIPRYYVRTLELNYYPPQADSIAIPILGAWMMIILAGPFLAVGFWICLRRAKPEFLQWNVWSAATPARSTLWTIVFGFLSISTIHSIFENFSIGLPLNACAAIGWLYVHPSLRAIIVAGLKSDYLWLRTEACDVTGAVHLLPVNDLPGV